MAGTEGVTASFIKELLRRSGLVAATADGASDVLQVSLVQLEQALDQLLGERNRLTRVLLGGKARGVDQQSRGGGPFPPLK
ncbi:MAG TPA: hypothetical protein VMW80_11515 [Candidatus Dormibacteraeota bacterium]|nr:hypothetical protein [Candidatus Dormibacteraeota bacterium]